MTVLAVFRSRAQALDFLNSVKKAGVPAQAVSTPKEAGVGCGISVKMDACFLLRAKNVLSGRSYSAFAGWMKQVGSGFSYTQ